MENDIETYLPKLIEKTNRTKLPKFAKNDVMPDIVFFLGELRHKGRLIVLGQWSPLVTLAWRLFNKQLRRVCVYLHFHIDCCCIFFFYLGKKSSVHYNNITVSIAMVTRHALLQQYFAVALNTKQKKISPINTICFKNGTNCKRTVSMDGDKLQTA